MHKCVERKSSVMSDDWSKQWSGECPRCECSWIHLERRVDGRTEHQRDGYTRLSAWTLECDNCEYINNPKRAF